MWARLRELNWQTSGKRTHLFERKILLSIFLIWRNIITLPANIWGETEVSDKLRIGPILINNFCRNILRKENGPPSLYTFLSGHLPIPAASTA